MSVNDRWKKAEQDWPDDPLSDLPPRRVPIFGWITIGAAIAVIVGSFGPWISVMLVFTAPLSVQGVSQTAGLQTASLAGLAFVLAAVSVAYRGMTIGSISSSCAMLALGGAALIGIDAWLDVARETNGRNDELLSVGWGLSLVIVGSGLGAVTALLHAVIAD